MLDVRAVPADAEVDGLAVLRVVAEAQRERDEPQRQVARDLVRFYAGG